MSVTWMIISGTFLIPFDSINQRYLDNAHSAGELQIQVQVSSYLFGHILTL